MNKPALRVDEQAEILVIALFRSQPLTHTISLATSFEALCMFHY